MGNFAEGWRETAASPDTVWALIAAVDHWPQNFTPHLRQHISRGRLPWERAAGSSDDATPAFPIHRDLRRCGPELGVARPSAVVDHGLQPPDPADGLGCRVTFDVDLGGPWAFVARGIARPVYRRQMEHALDLLVRAVERRS